MRGQLILEKDLEQGKAQIWDIVFNHDGTQILAVVNEYIACIDLTTSEYPLTLTKAHRDQIYCIAYSADGSIFATGSADKTVKVWTPDIKGKVMIPFSSSVQAVGFNPITKLLAAGTETDIGLWMDGLTQTKKEKVHSRVTCLSWSSNGAYLATGHVDGSVHIRNKDAKTLKQIIHKEPIWTLFWNPNPEYSDILTIGCWDQTITFVDAKGKTRYDTRKVNFDPCTLKPFLNGEYFIAAGSNKETFLFSREGIPLQSLGTSDQWVFSAACRGNSEYIACPTKEGKLGLYMCSTGTVHGLHKNMYARRETITSVFIQNLTNTTQTTRVNYGDYVKMIALYKTRLAVQLSKQIVISDLKLNNETNEIDVVKRGEFPFNKDTTLLLTTVDNVIICQTQKILLLSLTGEIVNEWDMHSVIPYLKVIGGMGGKECLLVGLMNGEVHSIYVDNPFSTRILTHSCAIRCLDYSMSRANVALIDENFDLFVYSTATKDVLVHEHEVTGVSFNTEFEEMLCYTNPTQLIIKVADLPVYRQPSQGLVVGMQGSKVFCLCHTSLFSIDVPQTDATHKFIQRKQYDSAYRIACLGVTDSDWQFLGTSAIRDLDIFTAKKAFLRVKDTHFLDLLSEIELDLRQQVLPGPVIVGKILAFLGLFKQAADSYVSADQPELAIQLFSDLRDYQNAILYSKDSTNTKLKDELVHQQAKWLIEIGKMAEAAKVYALAGQPMKAVTILGESKMIDDLAEVMRTTEMDDVTLNKCAEYFVRFKSHAYAREAYYKQGNMVALIQLHVKLGEWDEAISIAEANPRFLPIVFLPYAAWLAENGMFEEAQTAFKRAGRPDHSIHLLREMTKDAVVKKSFLHASNYLWLISQEMKESVDPTAPARAHVAETLSELYFAFHTIHWSVHAPFTTRSAEAIFNAGLMLVNTLRSESFLNLNLGIFYEPMQFEQTDLPATPMMLPNQTLLRDDSAPILHPIVINLKTSTRSTSLNPSRLPEGIRYSDILFSLHQQAWRLGAWRFLRTVCGELQTTRLFPKFAQQVELTTLLTRSKPLSDDPRLTQYCWKCASVNQLIINSKIGDCCQYCHHPFIRSFSSFLPLPLIKIYAPTDLGDTDAAFLLESLPRSTIASQMGGGGGVTEEDDGEYQRLSINPTSQTPGQYGSPQDQLHAGAGTNAKELFEGTELASVLYSIQHGDSRQPVLLSREGLRQVPPSTVFIARHLSPRPWEFYVNLAPSVSIVMCSICFRFFTEDDFTQSIYQTQRCPFCATHIDKMEDEVRTKYSVKTEKKKDDDDEEHTKVLAYTQNLEAGDVSSPSISSFTQGGMTRVASNAHLSQWYSRHASVKEGKWSKPTLANATKD
ncbi:putative Intraflagellar transport protein 122 like protein [Blattamonas nauphoetae]|uniref:Intraflagellar transport protein 122 homolog n=1 Tax=Blattamonas nauphoetae TaxID=2049346 RepID=A0ABQ9XD30_9EUKA|nr:putative Intraflagellar transport protein 122 like protein [Blattamonas nauphoetae]